MSAPTAIRTYRFGVFELNLSSRQLLKNGRELHLQEQPLRLLVSLLDRPGEVLTREELREKLWLTETYLEFDDGLNTAVQKIRQVLGDDARNPRFVETVPRCGYRFIAPVQTGGADVHPAPVAEAYPSRPTRSYWPWIAIASAVVSLAIGWLLPHGSNPLPAAPLKLSITAPAGVELRPGIRGGSAVSPDGRTVAFVASRNGKTMLWTRDMASLDTRELPGTEDALLPFWSPDSKSLGFMSGRKIRRVNLAGGPPRDLADASRPTRGTWCEDGTILFASGGGGPGGGPIYRVRATGGAAVPATSAGAGAASWPYAISGTDKFLYYDNARERVVLASLADSNKTEPLFAASTNAVYAPPHDGQPGYLLWMQGTTLLGQVFDARRGKLFGDPAPVAEGVGFTDGWHFADLSASNTGLLLYGAGNTALTRLTWLRRDGSLLEKVSEPDWFRSLRLSPDGRRAVIERGIARALWIMNFERNVLTRMTFEQGLSGWAAWSPDGRQIAYSGERGGQLSLYRRASSGATPEERLTASPLAHYMYDWSRDGRYMIYCEVHPQTKLDLWVLPLTGDRKPYPLLKTPFNEDSPRFSPDARWVAYVSDESGRNEVYVRSFPGTGGKWQISTAGGILPRWSGDGRELLYVAPDGYLMSAPLKPGRAEFEWSTPRQLFLTPMLGTPYDVAPRADKFLLLTPDEGFKRNELTVLINWRSGLRH
jgi:Tol biopolymer transport system component/DNA-binding winged helix-turn-helix (wHTH) protein